MFINQFQMSTAQKSEYELLPRFCAEISDYTVVNERLTDTEYYRKYIKT